MINKSKMKKSAGQKQEPTRGSKSAPSSGGPANYDGRENLRAESQERKAPPSSSQNIQESS